MHHPLFLPLLLALLLLGACGQVPSTDPAEAPAIGNAPEAEILEDVQERGRYLVTVLGCGDCHSPRVMGPQGPVPDPDRLLSGHPAGSQLPPYDATTTTGWVLFAMDQTATVGPWGTSFAANLTSDATGIGLWTEEMFDKALRGGWYKGIEGGRRLLPPMPWQGYASLTEADVHAIYTYLVSTAAVENVVPPPIPPGTN